jgi:2-amino-4-hydroxy-6-hydroxymethyldihydropteridine diphosphokinase
MEMLGNTDGIDSVHAGEMITTKALAKNDQSDYQNTAAKLEVSLSPEELLACMMKIEGKLGRTRPERYAPRTIDLDVLLYNDQIIETKELTVPHPQMHLRSFVMKPMAEIAPDLIHPVIGVSMDELCQRLNGESFMLSAETPQLISVAGIIGVGKTTLAKAIAEQLCCAMICEAYDTNPYIADVYAGKTELALDCQLYFLNSRIEQITPANLTSGSAAVSDYIFDKDKIFASRTLTTEQFSKYKEEYTAAAASVARPVLSIYLKDRPENALDRIHSRNRSYEQDIRIETLGELAAEYDDLFAGFKQCPVITLDAAKFNCMDNDHVQNLVKQIGSYIWRS